MNHTGDRPVPSASDGSGTSAMPLPDMSHSIQLFYEARNGNRAALNFLFERYYDRVYRIVKIRMGARLRGLLDSYDLVQETFLVASRKILDGFEPRDHSSIIQWLARIAEHQIHDAADRVRAGGKRDPDRELRIDALAAGPNDSHFALQLPARELGPSTIVADREQQERFDACVAKLPDAYRELVLLRDYAEASWEEICAQLGTSNVHATQERYRRARIKLAGLYRRHMPR